MLKGANINTSIKQSNNNGIDLGKFIMAFAVVALHTHPLEHCTNAHLLKVYSLFLDLAVPFFFLSSGYLLGIKLSCPWSSEDNTAVVHKYLIKILRMYLIWTLIYFPLALYYFISENIPFAKACLQYIRGFIFIGEQYNSWHLWYLLSTIYALIALIILLKAKGTDKGIMALIFTASILYTGFDFLAFYDGSLPSVLSLIQKIVKASFTSGRIFQGIILIPAGLLLSRTNIPKPAAFFLLFGGLTANFLINDIIISDYLLVLTPVGLFEIIKGLHLADSSIYFYMRKSSTIIYLIHMYIWTFYYTLVYGEKTYGADSFLAVSIISFLVSVIYIKWRRHSEFSRNQGI